MDVDFMVSDSLEVSFYAKLSMHDKFLEQAVRPKFELVKTVEEAAFAVDEMLNAAFQFDGAHRVRWYFYTI